jgi:hypothetical protein
MSEMNSKWIGRSPALIGAIFPLFGFIRGGGDDAAPTASSSGAQIAAYAYHHGIPNSMYYAELGAFLALMVFSIVLYSRLRSTEPRGAIAATVVVAACVVSVAIKLGSFPAVYALYSSPVQLDPGVARALWVLGEFAFTVSMLVQALSLGAVAASGLLFGGIPRWLAGTAGVIAVAMGVGFVLGGNFQVAPTLAWFLWLLVASIALFVRAPRTLSQERSAPTPLTASAV